MKTRHPMVAKIVSLLLLAAGAANAQITNTYNDLGSGDGNLAAINYDSWQHTYALGSQQGSSPELISAAAPNALGTNWIRSNFAGWTDPNDPGAGYQISSISLTLHVDSGAPNGTQTLNIYSGNGGRFTGSVVDSFDFTVPAVNGADITINIPTSVYASGFSIGWDTNSLPGILLNTATEHNTTLTFRPQVSFTYTEIIPEPSAVLLGSLGLLPLLRRRR